MGEFTIPCFRRPHMQPPPQQRHSHALIACDCPEVATMGSEQKHVLHLARSSRRILRHSRLPPTKGGGNRTNIGWSFDTQHSVFLAGQGRDPTLLPAVVASAIEIDRPAWSDGSSYGPCALGVLRSVLRCRPLSCTRHVEHVAVGPASDWQDIPEVFLHQDLGGPRPIRAICVDRWPCAPCHDVWTLSTSLLCGRSGAILA